MNPVHFSSKTDLWSTPQDFFDELNAEFNFTLDVCATAENAKCRWYYGTGTDALWPDGLQVEWCEVAEGGAAWMNPPYGNPEHPCRKNCNKKKCEKRGTHCFKYVPGIIDWVKKAVEEQAKGVTIVALLPARTDTTWFQKYVFPYAELPPNRWVRGRLKFGGSKNSAPFPSVVAVYRGRT
jgi:phage N-6-adenine-methyltransferase